VGNPHTAVRRGKTAAGLRRRTDGSGLAHAYRVRHTPDRGRAEAHRIL